MEDEYHDHDGILLEDFSSSRLPQNNYPTVENKNMRTISYQNSLPAPTLNTKTLILKGERQETKNN